ncbi:hypothetical protein BLAT2472_20261 [Burkholderia latens]
MRRPVDADHYAAGGTAHVAVVPPRRAGRDRLLLAERRADAACQCAPADDLRGFPGRARPADGMCRSRARTRCGVDEGERRIALSQRGGRRRIRFVAARDALRLHEGDGTAQPCAADRRGRYRVVLRDADPGRPFRHEHRGVVARVVGHAAHAAADAGRGTGREDRAEVVVPVDLLHFPGTDDGAARAGDDPRVSRAAADLHQYRAVTRGAERPRETDKRVGGASPAGTSTVFMGGSSSPPGGVARQVDHSGVNATRTHGRPWTQP